MARRSWPFLSVTTSPDSPLQVQLYEQLRRSILDGRFKAGAALPSSRALAEELEISRNTAILAYERLASEGYLISKAGSGIFVSPELPDDALRLGRLGTGGDGARKLRWPSCLQPSQRSLWMASFPSIYSNRAMPLVPFRPSLPAFDEFPVRIFSRFVAQAWSEASALELGYGSPAGYALLREEVAGYLREYRGVRCTAEQIVITAGTQHALFIATQVLLEQGEVALIEDPGYLAARSAMLSGGAELRSLDIDSEGAVVPPPSNRARVAYVTPSFQYPTGVVMSLPRRLAWLEWARRTSGWILEDDYDSEFRYAGRPLPALQGIEPDGRVVYIGTFSKVLVPGVRLGYMVVPDGLVEACTAVRKMSGVHSQTLDQIALAKFIKSGHFVRHLRRMRKLYSERQEVLVDSVRKELSQYLAIEPYPAGMQLPAYLTSHHNIRTIVTKAERHGLLLVPLERFACTNRVARGFLLGYTSFSPRKLREGCARLRAVFAET